MKGLGQFHCYRSMVCVFSVLSFHVILDNISDILVIYVEAFVHVYSHTSSTYLVLFPGTRLFTGGTISAKFTETF